MTLPNIEKLCLRLWYSIVREMINVYAFSYWDILVSMNEDMMDQGMTVVVTVEIH